MDTKLLHVKSVKTNGFIVLHLWAILAKSQRGQHILHVVVILH